MFYPFLFPGGGFWERQHLVSHTTTCVPRQEKVFFFLLLHHEGKCCRFHFPPLSFASLWEGAFPLGACCVRNKKNFWWREKESFHQIRNLLPFLQHFWMGNFRVGIKSCFFDIWQMVYSSNFFYIFCITSNLEICIQNTEKIFLYKYSMSILLSISSFPATAVPTPLPPDCQDYKKEEERKTSSSGVSHTAVMKWCEERGGKKRRFFRSSVLFFGGWRNIQTVSLVLSLGGGWESVCAYGQKTVTQQQKDHLSPSHKITPKKEHIALFPFWFDFETVQKLLKKVLSWFQEEKE